MFKNIRTRIFLTYFLLIFFVIALMGTLFVWFIKTHLSSTREDYLISSSEYFIKFINPYIKSNEDVGPASKFFLRQYWDQMDYDLSVVNSQGEVVADSAGLPPFPIQGDKKMLSVLQTGKPLLWQTADQGSPYFYYCVPIIVEDKIGGAAKLGMSTEEFGEVFAVLRYYFLVTFVCSLLAAILLALIFIKTLMKPVAKIRDTAYQISQGDFDSRVNYTSSDELGDLGRTINQMAADLKKLEQTRTDFLANISHELRTPLTIIKGFAVTLLEEKDGSSEEYRYLEIINRESDRLSRLVNELLELSRLRTGRFSLRLEKCSMADILSSISYQMNERAKQLDAELILHQEEDLPPFLADSDRIQEVFINLIDNALKYSSTGGRRGQVEVTVKKEEGHIAIAVSDNGPGISSEEQTQLFERFFQGGSRMQAVEGVGLGLAIVREIVDAHKGVISLESEKGRGSSFTVKIPIIESKGEKGL